jgi:hypothetical protein
VRRPGDDGGPPIRSGRLGAVVAAAVLLVTLGATVVSCAVDDDTDAPTPPGAGPLSTQPDLATMAERLRDEGIDCVLEYEGLADGDTTVSICVVGDTQVTLRIWDDPASVQAFVQSGLASDRTAYGTNWTVDAREPQVAARVAGALGGRTGEPDDATPAG